MRQDFETAELQEALERALGFRMKPLVRMDGASALNFRAERADDGFRFAVKCSPSARQAMFEHLVRHLAETDGTKAVRRLFADVCPPTFRGWNLICLSWCEGERRFPDRLSEAELTAFLEDYREFSTALQRSSGIVRADPLAEWRAGALAACGGFWARPLKRLIEREIPSEQVVYQTDRLRVVHGDFHHGNFLFANGRVNGFFDLEEFCWGYPSDDIVRYFVCAAEHLRWYERGRRTRLLARFALAVRTLPYPRGEWLVAINGLLVRKLFMKTQDGVGPFRAFNLRWRARLYARMRELVLEETRP